MNEASDFHEASQRTLERARLDPSPAYLTWSVCYEFLRTATHPRLLEAPLSPRLASDNNEEMLPPPAVRLLVATERHMDILARTIEEFPDTRANGMHDLHTVVLMPEHGISRICTLDSGFRRYPFLTVVEPGA